jgi:hypothetical protein
MELQPYEIQSKIYEIRGRRVMLDFDLAEMYDVSTKALKQAVRRNLARFPDDFMFELSESEYNSLKHSLRSQIVTSNKGGIRYMPFAFTQEGAAMLSGVLRSPIAVQANIRIMRAFVAVREYLLSHASLSAEMAQLRERILRLEQTNERLERTGEDNLEAINDLSEDMQKELETIYDAIGALSVKLPKLEKPRRSVGFKQEGREQGE